jgi:predicted DNA-binding transcriptional regulator YafY
MNSVDGIMLKYRTKHRSLGDRCSIGTDFLPSLRIFADATVGIGQPLSDTSAQNQPMVDFAFPTHLTRFAMPKSPEIPQSRPPLARMVRIHEQFQHAKRINCSIIAELLEVSVKTAQRDIEFMRDQWNLPIEYDRSKHGYYYTHEVTEFPALRVTEGEIVSLLVAQRALEQYRGTPFENTLQTAFAKITSSLKDEISFNASEVMSGFAFRSVGTSRADLVTFDAVSRGIRQRREVTITYQKPASTKAETRRVQPHLLANIQNLWYAICFDPQKNDFRRFALPRIKSTRLENTKFERQAGFSADKFLANAFGAFGGSEDIEVKVRFDSFAATFIQERFWHPTEKFKALPKGGLEFSMHVPRLEEVEAWVLGWGGHAEVLEPPRLIEMVRNAGKMIAAQYA